MRRTLEAWCQPCFLSQHVPRRRGLIPLFTKAGGGRQGRLETLPYSSTALENNHFNFIERNGFFEHSFLCKSNLENRSWATAVQGGGGGV